MTPPEELPRNHAQILATVLGEGWDKASTGRAKGLYDTASPERRAEWWGLVEATYRATPDGITGPQAELLARAIGTTPELAMAHWEQARELARLVAKGHDELDNGPDPRPRWWAIIELVTAKTAAAARRASIPAQLTTGEAAVLAKALGAPGRGAALGAIYATGDEALRTNWWKVVTDAERRT